MGLFCVPKHMVKPMSKKVMAIQAVKRDFQQCGILTSVASEEPVHPSFKLRSSK